VREEVPDLSPAAMISRGRGAPPEIGAGAPAPAAPAGAIAPESSESAGVSTRFLDPVLASPRAD